MNNNTIIFCIIYLIIIFLIVLNTKYEPFENVKLHGISGTDWKPSADTETIDISNPFIKYDLSSEEETKKQTINTLQQEEVEKKQKYYDNKVQVYNQILLEENKDVTFFYNDVFDQSGITENAEDIINMRDKVDYSKVKTGYDKCKNACMNGICVEIGYSGTTQCIPLPTQSFDWGTLRKNPEFTEGLQIPNNNVNFQYF